MYCVKHNPNVLGCAIKPVTGNADMPVNRVLAPEINSQTHLMSIDTDRHQVCLGMLYLSML